MAVNHLLPDKLTTSGRPVLIPYEVECFFLSNVDLESKYSPPVNFSVRFKSGLLILTTRRLIGLPPDPVPPGSKGACVSLAVVSHIFSSKKSIKTIFATRRCRKLGHGGFESRVRLGHGRVRFNWDEGGGCSGDTKERTGDLGEH